MTHNTLYSRVRSGPARVSLSYGVFLCYILHYTVKPPAKTKLEFDKGLSLSKKPYYIAHGLCHILQADQVPRGPVGHSFIPYRVRGSLNVTHLFFT